MKISTVVFLILIVMSSVAFAQAPSETPLAAKIDEFGQLPSGDMKARFDGFFNEIIRTPADNGSIIIYGSVKESLKQEMFFKTYMRLRRIDNSRVSIIKGGYRNEINTQFWLIPAGAETPTIELTARIFDEFGELRTGDFKARMDSFFSEIYNNPNAKALLINYGTNRETAVRERNIKTFAKNRKFDFSKIDFVKATGEYGINTVLWIVPEGAEVPKP